MRRTLMLCIVVAFVGCGQSDESEGGAMALSLSDVAGTWTIPYAAEGGDSAVITVHLNATSTTEGWTMTVPGRDPIPLHVVHEGDSVVTHGGPFESALRPGVMVTTESVFRLVDGGLEARTVGRYSTQSADSIARFHGRGMRAP